MKILITGGAGFIGSNATNYFLGLGHEVTIFDNFSRKGTESNLEWLKKNHPTVKVIRGDTRNFEEIKKAVAEGYDVVIHLAAQVAVTTSVVNPREDFEINALGTFNMLEACRLAPKQPIVIYSSTNKVYGGMEDIKTVERNGRYEYADLPDGVPENRLLDFHSPYGCSKGSADQYVRDYSRIYGLKTVVCRQSCIYGYRQFGVEDQGWVAWFIIATVLNKNLTIYGDGKQVRDVLFVEDLVAAYDSIIKNIDKVSGNVYNIGGGSKNQMSLLELIAFIESFTGKKLEYKFSDWRPGDQPVFVCDIAKAKREFGWEPKVSVEEGVKKLFNWVKENKNLFA
ncbi:MAG: NAD-dependent epimerase/dehydratase, CDP-paratose 2-epimerase [Candidatus Peregrinibacteria bacterium GW2011_GWF2_43_17]|nr:MAG: NAD-dependent epimerase/dehydratase, CDP-paratose 2-epimerase [Candidatus Peregrinibacteria bacterium GW2011_GWF2_43_17]KKT19657.1 MAG: dTDP-D-glucose 4,6-dehydratase [Candidatus Peregrinibacteria bacterium GW2011_GWA2_43_8]HAU40051.1 CDP-paratose 2-epimerase [Candidatus Peregrinibacteria bacterium]